MNRSRVRHTPTLSIVMPSYNQGQYIERAILSILEQDDPNLRLAIVDGGSTDGTVEVIKRYESHLDYWCSEPDGGQSAAIVKGFSKIGGDLRGWLNSDDEYVHGAFRRVRRVFDARPGVGLVYGNRILIDPSSAVIGWTREPAFDPSVAGYSIASEAAFWTAEAERTSGPIDPSLNFAMDLDFFVRMYLAVDSVKVRDYLGRLRCHDESKSATIPEQGRLETQLLWQRFFGDSETWKVPEKRRLVARAAAGLGHPLLLAAPYARTRVGRTLRGRGPTP